MKTELSIVYICLRSALLGRIIAQSQVFILQHALLLWCTSRLFAESLLFNFLSFKEVKTAHQESLPFFNYFTSLQMNPLEALLQHDNGHRSQEIRDIIPVPLRRVRTAKSSTHSHPFQVSLPNPRILSPKSSFINLWFAFRSSCFPESYSLPSFKSKSNILDLISLSS